MAKPKLGEYGYNPYDTSPDVPVVPGAVTPPPAAPYMSGGMPTGYNPNDSAQWWQDSGQYVTPGSPTYDPSKAGSNQPVVPPVVPPPEKTWQDELKDSEVINPPITPPNIGAPEGTDKVLTPYGDLVNLPKLSYVSPYTKDYWNEARTTFQNNLQASTQPALDKALAGSREQSIRLGGASSGLIQAGQQPILESYGRDFTQQMGGFEQKALDAQISESKDAAIWENTQNKEIRDFYSTQQLDKGSWDRLQKADSEINRITNLYKNQEINSTEAWNQYKVASDERLRVLDTARQDILLKLSIAEKDKDWEKKKSLDLELANITKESNRQMADAQEKAGMWGALGSIVGVASGFGLKKLFE
jgi:hypothetical protein